MEMRGFTTLLAVKLASVSNSKPYLLRVSVLSPIC